MGILAKSNIFVAKVACFVNPTNLIEKTENQKRVKC
jgi:hypothetical protein